MTLADDMVEESIEGKTITLKLKATNFELRTRAATLGCHIRLAEEMMPHVRALLKAELPIEIRLMGLRMSNLRPVGREKCRGQLDALLRKSLTSNTPFGSKPSDKVASQQGCGRPGCTVQHQSGCSLKTEGPITSDHAQTEGAGGLDPCPSTTQEAEVSDSSGQVRHSFARLCLW